MSYRFFFYLFNCMYLFVYGLGGHTFPFTFFLCAHFKVKHWIRKVFYFKTIRFTLRSWTHKISTGITSCFLDLRTAIHCNIVRTIFQYKHSCQDSWKNPRSTFYRIIILQSRWQDPKKSENYGTNLSLTRIRTLSPVLKKNNALKCCFDIFPTTLTYAFMLEDCRNTIVM